MACAYHHVSEPLEMPMATKQEEQASARLGRVEANLGLIWTVVALTGGLLYALHEMRRRRDE